MDFEDRIKAFANSRLLLNKDTLAENGLEYRKNKTNLDVEKAVERIKKPKIGYGKIEIELNMFEVYLTKILKMSK